MGSDFWDLSGYFLGYFYRSFDERFSYAKYDAKYNFKMGSIILHQSITVHRLLLLDYEAKIELLK